MVSEFSTKGAFLFGVLFAFVIVYLWFFTIFMQENIWWVLPAGVYLVFFITKNQSLKQKHHDDAWKIKPRKDIRIKFWN